MLCCQLAELQQLRMATGAVRNCCEVSPNYYERERYWQGDLRSFASLV